MWSVESQETTWVDKGLSPKSVWDEKNPDRGTVRPESKLSTHESSEEPKLRTRVTKDQDTGTYSIS